MKKIIDNDELILLSNESIHHPASMATNLSDYSKNNTMPINYDDEGTHLRGTQWWSRHARCLAKSEKGTIMAS